jgi:hypothetical protein
VDDAAHSFSGNGEVVGADLHLPKLLGLPLAFDFAIFVKHFSDQARFPDCAVVRDCGRVQCQLQRRHLEFALPDRHVYSRADRPVECRVILGDPVRCRDHAWVLPGQIDLGVLAEPEPLGHSAVNGLDAEPFEVVFLTTLALLEPIVL